MKLVRMSDTQQTTSHLSPHVTHASKKWLFVSSASATPGKSRMSYRTPSSLVSSCFAWSSDESLSSLLRASVPTRKTSFVVRHTPDWRTRMPSSAFTIDDFPAEGKPMRPTRTDGTIGAVEAVEAGGACGAAAAFSAFLATARDEFSRAVLTVWHGAHSGCMFCGSSAPPSASAMM